LHPNKNKEYFHGFSFCPAAPSSLEPQIRSLVQETRLSPADFIMPLFVRPGSGVQEPIASMPGVFRHSIDRAVEECRRIRNLGIRAVLLFGIPERKDETGEAGADDNGIVQQAIGAIKHAVDGLLIISDVCNCAYTTHGHCGIVTDGKIDNDRTLGFLAVRRFRTPAPGATWSRRAI